MLLFQILQKRSRNKSCTFFEHRLLHISSVLQIRCR